MFIIRFSGQWLDDASSWFLGNFGTRWKTLCKHKNMLLVKIQHHSNYAWLPKEDCYAEALKVIYFDEYEKMKLIKRLMLMKRVSQV